MAFPESEPSVEPVGEPQEPVAETEAPAVESESETFDDSIWNDPAKARDAGTKARQEAADRRIKLKELEDRYGIFNEYDEGEQEALLQLVRGLKEDPYATAKDFQTIANNILATAGDDVEDNAEAVEEEASKYLTEDKLKTFMAQYEQNQQLERTTQEILSKARELGYQDGTDEQILLLNIAANKTNGDIDKAHARVEAVMQARFDKFVEQRKNEPTAPNDGTVASGEAELPKDFKTARQLAMARVDAAEGPDPYA